MSSSTQDPQDEGDEKQNVDELEETTGGNNESDAAVADALPKRGRGRPKGSKNKRPGMTPAATAGSSTAVTPRKRGRPPKEKKPEGEADAEPPAKRKRGRPPKIPKSETGDDAGGSGEATESSAKKKRGRPKKATD
ncbi:hypothetical protein C0993_011512 [Termitomyces sp. T159_Od127]|nr:hypothetical protein C0993_011512 [Termitomyces sp. T159_Od127]